MHAVNNTVTGIVPVRWKTQSNSGRMAGILNAFCYVGSTISSYLLGLVADTFGWGAVMYVFLGAAVVAVTAGAVFLLLRRSRQTMI